MRRLAALLLLGACSSVSSEQASHDVPSAESFYRVSAVLSARCGSLDCHGQTGRGLRLYGQYGLRLAKHDVPGVEKDTQDEVDANYAAVVGLEPEILEQVQNDGGRDPERLTLIRKGRNAEKHKGGHAFNDDADRCVVSWLEGEIDKKACNAAAVLERPPGFEGGTGGTGNAGGTGGSGGTPAGGSGGTLPSGGAPSGGTGGGGSGGAGGNGGTGGTATGGTGGVICAPGDFWPCTWDASCTPAKPTPADHSAYLFDECQTCHSPGGSAGPGKEFLIGGVLWLWGGKVGAAHKEVGLRDGTTFLYTCTDDNGFFYLPLAGTPVPDWKAVETRMRGEFGEKTMPPDKEHAANCNSSKCHGAVDHRLWAPD